MATARIVLDKRKAKQDGTFPVKIRIANIKDFQRIGTTISLSENDFSKLMKGKNLNEHLKPLKIKLDILLNKANRIIADHEPFDFDVFNSHFYQKGNKTDLLFLLKDKAERLRREEKHGNANLYHQASALLSRYNTSLNKSPELPLKTVTSKWLKDFEKWVLKLKRKNNAGEIVLEYGMTTIGMYLIRVRAIFNEVITNNELHRTFYPFHTADNQGGYKIPKGANNKRALTITEIMLLYNYTPVNKGEEFAKDIFIFSYLSSGMNTIDIFKLKWSDVKGDHFSFIRKKTENKSGGTNKININLTQDLLAIIDRHGTPRSNFSYIFNIIPIGASEKEILQKTRTAITSINVHLKKIASKVGITQEISTYFARHSFANNLMNSEVPLAFISKQLGHTDLKTTQSYLDSFTNEKSLEYQSNLLKKTI